MYPAKPSTTSVSPAPASGIPTPVAASPTPVAPSQWSSGLCSCFDDCGLCCLTCWCPCITFGRVAEMMDRGATSCATSGTLYALLTGCQGHWIYSCTYRARMRDLFGLPDVGCCDCCVHLCCEPCALCQEYRELVARGFDPALGWDLNRRHRPAVAATMYPPSPVHAMDR